MIFDRILLLTLASTLATSAAGGDATATNGYGAVATNGDSTEITTCNDQTLTLTSQPLMNSRDYLYCELVFNYPDGCGGDIYSTSPLAECDLDWWNNLDLDSLAQEFGADSITKNGPQSWSMDEVTGKVSEPVNVGGANMAFGANLPPGTVGSPMYTVFYPSKTQYLVWDAGKPTYRLKDAEGYEYVVQGYKVAQDDLATLGDQFESLPEGWEYIVVTPDEDLIFDLTPENPIPSVQDEFDQIYIRVPDTRETPSAGEKVLVATSSFILFLFSGFLFAV